MRFRLRLGTVLSLNSSGCDSEVALPANPSITLTLPRSLPCSQVGDESYTILNGFGTVVNSLGQRAKPYLPQICGTIKWRLNNKSAKIRQQVRMACVQ